MYSYYVVDKQAIAIDITKISTSQVVGIIATSQRTSSDGDVLNDLYDFIESICSTLLQKYDFEVYLEEACVKYLDSKFYILEC